MRATGKDLHDQRVLRGGNGRREIAEIDGSRTGNRSWKRSEWRESQPMISIIRFFPHVIH
jgi:hypothetical protein